MVPAFEFVNVETFAQVFTSGSNTSLAVLIKSALDIVGK